MGRVTVNRTGSAERNRELQRKRNIHGNSNRPRQHGRLVSDIARNEKRSFIGWDGEGHSVFVVNSEGTCTREHRYMLFGCSTLHYESSKTIESLATATCLDLILYVESQNPDAFHVGFSFEYDVNMILKDLEWRYLAILYDVGMVKWKGYRIKHIPHKMFSVSKSGVSATIYDVFGFFHCSYLKALAKFGIGTQEETSIIQAGKNLRASFIYSDLPMVIGYWSREISLLPPLMSKIREACYGAGFFITQWHGPGALASFATKKYGIAKARPGKNISSQIRTAARYAYAGGRFQAWQCGLLSGDIFTADINSAYAFACSQLPDLRSGKWEHAFNPKISAPGDIRHFALYRISFDARELERQARERGIPFPLFHRDKVGHLSWPHKTEGWYWAPEAALVAGSKYAEFREAWIYHDNGKRPFEFVLGAYNRRLLLQADANPAEKAYKWFLASIYGQLAQRVGWNRNTRSAPPSHCLEWAGYITSYCRALVFRAALDVSRRGGLISIDTDGVTSTVPFDPAHLPGGIGSALGQWKLEHFTGVLYWQNGIYWLRGEDGEWTTPKTRGIKRGTIGINQAMISLGVMDYDRKAKNPTIKISRTRFIGYRQGLQHRFDDWRQWVDQSVEVEFGGSGKGRHVPALCSTCYGIRSKHNNGDEQLHTLVHFPPDHVDSRPHDLPWLKPQALPETNVKDQGIWRDEAI
jgi:hypothetical protein